MGQPHTFFSFIVIISNLILIPKTNKNWLDAIFQPLLQIYLLLPCVIARMSCQQSSNVMPLSEFFTGSLQTYSIVSSVVSLAWSFSTYEANQKKGALDFSSNPIARIVILVSALMQVIHKKMCKANACSMPKISNCFKERKVKVLRRYFLGGLIK